MSLTLLRPAVLMLISCGWLCACVTNTNKPYVDQSAAYNKRVELGMQYLSVDKRDNARRQFSKALEFRKDGAEAYHGIALVHQANGEMDPAGKNFTRALRLASKAERAPIAVS